MKTTEEVCRQFGFEYAPMRISYKDKVQLRDLTPRSKEERKFKNGLILLVLLGLGIVLGALYVMTIIANNI